MIRYKKFQFGWVIIITFVIVLIWMTFAFIKQWGNNPIDIYGYILFMAIFAGVLSGFYGMTLTVTDEYLKIKFGIGFYTKRIDLKTVKSVRVLKYPAYYGYGIRIVPNGILYNVSGKHAVEIMFKHKKKIIQIGTNDWDNLKMAIESGIIKN